MTGRGPSTAPSWAPPSSSAEGPRIADRAPPRVRRPRPSLDRQPEAGDSHEEAEPDGSGFVQYVFNKHGVRLPRTAGEQAEVGQALPSDWRAISAGDLVMFEDEGRINHVAIYAGRNRIIHSSASGGGVRYDDLSTRRGEWFADHMVAARRVTPDSRGLLLDLARSFSEASSLQLDPPDRAPKPR